MTSDTYRSIAQPASAEIKVRGSRFIAEAFPVATEEAAEAHIDRIRKREHAATHHCTAYRIGPGAAIFRFNDDGEPSGTAGPPILRQIEGRSLTNTLVVVTRYYGGTKLGAGGLVRAYGDAASEALDAAGQKKHVIFERLNVSYRYDDTSAAMHVINQYDAEVIDSTYTDKTELELAVRKSRVQAFREAFTNALGGRGAVTGPET